MASFLWNMMTSLRPGTTFNAAFCSTILGKCLLLGLTLAFARLLAIGVTATFRVRRLSLQYPEHTSLIWINV